MAENGNGRRAIISRDTLLPLSLVLLVGGGMFGAGAAWNGQSNRITANAGDIGDHETRLKLAEARLELWRRLVEVRLSMQLPEPKDAALRPEPADPPAPPPVLAFGGLGTPPPGSEPGG
jgi:hypothetical protein